MEKAVECAPKDAIIREHLGDAYLKTNLRDKALEMYEGALSLEPEKGEIKEKIENLLNRERN